MTQVIDERVVEMKFDNQNFEKNVAQSMSTLDKLKQALNIDSAKSLRDITANANKVDMSRVGYAVEEVKASFSALQVVGITALSEITKAAMNLGANLISKVVNPIKSGGMNRALNIEQAKFQLEGLGVAWKDIEDDINYGVKDTAYGLDAAAKAASQLVASGVQLGDEMKNALRGISGVAAMTNTSFEEISPIFTTIAGQGKVMTMQLRQLENRGLNAAATLAKFLGTTEEEIREMVTKGKIDFETFATAMDDAFGTHAKEANKTFTGAMSNVRAALSRIGANFATPYMENMRLIAVESIKVINQINKFLNPIYSDVSKIMETVQKTITSFLQGSDVINSAHSIIISVKNTFEYISYLVHIIGEAFHEIFPKQEFGSVLRNATLALERFTSQLSISDKATDDIQRTFKGLFSILDILKTAFTQVIDAIKPYKRNIEDVLHAIMDFTATVGDYITEFSNFVKENDTFGKAFRTTAFAVQVSIVIIKNAIRDVVDTLKNFKQIHLDSKDFSGIQNFFNRFKDAIKNFQGIGSVLKKIFGNIAEAFEGFKPVVKAMGELVSSLVGGVLSGFANAFGDKKLDAFSAFLNILSTSTAAGMMLNLAGAFSQLGKTIKTMGGLSPILTAIRTGLKDTFAQIQADLKADVLLRLGKALALFAGSLLVLSMINPDRLMIASGAIAGILAAFSFALNGINSLTNNISGLLPVTDVLKNAFNNLSNSISQFIKVKALVALGVLLLQTAAAVGILALSLRAIATLKPEQLIGGLGAIVGLMYALYRMAESFQNKDVFKQKAIMAGASQLIMLSVAVRILASAVKTIGRLEFDQVLKGVGSVVVIMFAMTEMLQRVSGKTINVGTGLAFIELATAINLIGKAIASLGGLGEDEILQGGIAVGAIGAALALFLKFVSDFGNLGDMGSTATAVLALSASIYIVAQSIKSLGELEMEQVGTGLVALGVALVAMGGGLKILSESTNAADLATTAGALVTLGIAVGLISASLSLLSQQDPLNVVFSLLAVAGAITAFAVAAVALKPVMGSLLGFAGSLALFGVSVLALGAGLLMLSAAVTVFNSVGPGLIDILLSLAIGIGAFAMAAMVLQPVLVPMALLAGALALVGVAALATGAGFMMVSMGLASIAAIGTSGAVALEAVALAMGALSLGIVAFAASLAVLALGIFALVKMFALVDVTMVGTSALTVVLALAFAAATVAFAAFSVACTIAAGVISILAASLLVLFAVLGQVFPLFDDISKDISDMFTGMKETVIGALDTLKESIKEEIGNMIQLGKDFISGFLEGLKDIPILGGIIEAGENIAKAAINAVKRTQDSNSPSKVTEALGEDFGIGYGQGMDKTKTKVEKAATDVADTAIDALKDAPPEANKAGQDTTEQFSLGILENIPFVKEATDQVRGAMDLSDAVEESEWDLHQVMENYNKAMKLKKGYENAKARNEQIRKRLQNKGIVELETEAINAETEAEDTNTTATGKNSKAKEEKKNVLESLKDTLESQMDIFTKFEMKTDITAEQMLENMKSNLDGFASWSARLAQLAERGISKALWEKLAEMGPKGYAELNAFINMTDEQLQQANDMYAASLAMDDSVIAQISPSYEKLGGEIPKGIAEGIRKWQEETKTAVVKTSQVAQTAFKEDNGIASPSTVYRDFGINIIEGLRLGILDPSALIFLEDTIRLVSTWNVLEVFKSILTYEEFYNIGINLDYGLRDGINAGAEEAYAAATTVAENVLAIMKNVPKESSPSKVTRQIGFYISEGLAIGIRDAGQNVIDASEMVVNGAIDTLSNVNKINNLIDTSIDFNPIITPMLDLSYIQSQVQELDNMLSNKTMDASLQNEGTNGSGIQQFNYTQNNYSPKSLSRYEIYRQTNRQLSSIRKAVRG